MVRTTNYKTNNYRRTFLAKNLLRISRRGGASLFTGGSGRLPAVPRSRLVRARLINNTPWVAVKSGGPTDQATWATCPTRLWVACQRLMMACRRGRALAAAAAAPIRWNIGSRSSLRKSACVRVLICLAFCRSETGRYWSVGTSAAVVYNCLRDWRFLSAVDCTLRRGTEQRSWTVDDRTVRQNSSILF